MEEVLEPNKGAAAETELRAYTGTSGSQRGALRIGVEAPNGQHITLPLLVVAGEGPRLLGID